MRGVGIVAYGVWAAQEVGVAMQEKHIEACRQPGSGCGEGEGAGMEVGLWLVLRGVWLSQWVRPCRFWLVAHRVHAHVASTSEGQC